MNAKKLMSVMVCIIIVVAIFTLSPKSVLEGSADNSKLDMDKLYAVEPAGNITRLISIDVQTAQVETVINLSGPIIGASALAFSPDGELIGFDYSRHQLFRINVGTGQIERIGTSNSVGGHASGIAFDRRGDLYGLDTWGDRLLKIDPVSGTSTVVGPTVVDIKGTGMAINFRTNELYAVSGVNDGVTDKLLKIDKSTGRATVIGDLGHDLDSVGAEFNPITGELFAVRDHNLLVKIDVDTGAAVGIGTLGDVVVNNLAAQWPITLPPTLYINISQDGSDVILNWDPLSTQGIDHYLIYRSTSQTDFDFDTVWVNTSEDREPGESKPISLRTMWNDTNAAFPNNVTNYKEQYYYTIRAVDIRGEVSRTSRTVGKWTKTFPQGISTFSLPLEPLQTMWTDDLTTDMSANCIKYMDTTTHTWMQNNVILEVSKGYEINLDASTKFTFTGMPAAMILYDDVSFGFDATPGSNGVSLTATVDDNENVILSWLPAADIYSGYEYHVLRSSTRDGFWGGKGQDYEQIANLPFSTSTYQDIGIAVEGTEYYYMIVPVNLSTNEKGISSYSLGVWTADYLGEYDTFGIPLKPSNYQTADWYCDNIPNTVGINYYIRGEQRWGWHSTRMPAGAYDPILEMTEGYQISTSSATRFSFIGA